MNRPTHVRSNLARVAARKLFNELGIKEPPIRGQEVVFRFARLFHFVADSEENGVTRYNPVTGLYEVYVNPMLNEGRLNFTYIHEVAHIVLKHHEMCDSDYLTESERWMLDREANIFASEFLMHKLWVKRLAKPPITMLELGQLRKTFGVSWEALIYRLDELGIQSVKVTQELLKLKAVNMD